MRIGACVEKGYALKGCILKKVYPFSGYRHPCLPACLPACHTLHMYGASDREGPLRGAWVQTPLAVRPTLHMHGVAYMQGALYMAYVTCRGV